MKNLNEKEKITDNRNYGIDLLRIFNRYIT